ncbi:ribonucleoside-diphosphate reductase small chain-like protein [Ephemerocybe angulata]|uniref:Ribonucleoside-diphosphate reductase small chain-like protein n=1 Tax=Ephemerocybe angulata TaxID=980116 RepID=A0A8H6HBB3_9AGAR|nr:ribonucleoside-diphosphate reductase small chain-like protein [Tulosesus angulatus]
MNDTKDSIWPHRFYLRSALPIRVPTVRFISSPDAPVASALTAHRQQLWQMYLDARDTLWLPTDLELEADTRDWLTSMSESEKWIVTRALGFFATVDGLIADNIITRFSQEVAYIEAKYFYGLQVVVEHIHSETYAKLINALIPDEEEQSVLLTWSTTVPSIAFKNIWVLKWIVDDSRTFAERLAAFICVEGIFFSSCFALLSWIKSNGKMPGLSAVNDLISKDENRHLDFACALFRRIRSPPSSSAILETVRDAVDVETDFAMDMLSVPGHNISLQDIHQYIRFVANRLLVKMGYGVAYVADNPVTN